MLKARVLTAVALLLALLACVFLLPKLAWAGVVGGVLWLAAGEWLRLTAARGVMTWVFRMLAVLPALLFALLPGEDALLLGLAVHLGAVSFWWFTVSAILRLKPQFREGVGRYIVGWVVLVPASLAMIQLREISPWLLLGAMAMVWLADIGAYFAGRAFGRHKLAPGISPGKTWEGVLGGTLAVLVFALLCQTFVPALQALSPLVLILFALLYTATSVEGDLFESLLKRQAGLKDSGDLLPGHGGLLDRIDSLLPTLPLATGAVLILSFLA